MAEEEDDGLLDRSRRLAEHAASYAGRTGRLAAEEARQIILRGGRRALLLSVAAALAAIGALFVLVAAALLAGSALGAPWIGFAGLGAVLLVGGGFVARRLARKLADPSLRFPVTRREIRSDLEWIRNGNGKKKSDSRS